MLEDGHGNVFAKEANFAIHVLFLIGFSHSYPVALITSILEQLPLSVRGALSAAFSEQLHPIHGLLHPRSILSIHPTQYIAPRVVRMPPCSFSWSSFLRHNRSHTTLIPTVATRTQQSPSINQKGQSSPIGSFLRSSSESVLTAATTTIMQTR